MRNYNNYQRAIRYATKLIKNYNAPYSPMDLVHDSYITYFGYKHENLFETTPDIVIKTVKNKFFNNLNSQSYVKNGNKQKFQFIESVEDSSLEDTSKNNNTYILKTNNTPIDILEKKESKRNVEYLEAIIDKNLSEFEKRVLDLRIDTVYSDSKDYRDTYESQYLSEKNIEIIATEFPPTKLGREIKDKKSAHRNILYQISKAKDNIRKIMNKEYQSPFNGSKLKIVKRITKNQFDKHREEYLRDWEMGEDSDSNEYYIQLTSKTNPQEGLLVKGKGSD